MSSENITFVVQGKVIKNDDVTLRAIQSIKKYYPRAIIILSTWNMEDVPEVMSSLCDNVIYSVDPLDYTPKSTSPLNINRQIVSSSAGIAQSKTKFTVKTRTDLLFTSSSIVNLLDDKLEINHDYLAGEARLHCSDFSSRHHSRGMMVDFWISDFIYFGLTSDLKRLFDVPEYSLNDIQYFVNNRMPDYFKDKKHMFKYTPETYLTYKYLNFKGDIVLDNTFHKEKTLTDKFVRLLVNSIRVHSAYEIGVKSLKYRYPLIPVNEMYSTNDWIADFNKFNNGNLSKKWFLSARIKFGALLVKCLGRDL